MKKFKLPEKIPRNWKLSQVMYLITNCNHFDIKKAVEFIGKSQDTIYEMKRRLEYYTCENWTKEQEIFLLENGIEETSLLTNRTLNACRIKKLRLQRK